MKSSIIRRAYGTEQVKRLIREAGLELLAVYARERKKNRRRTVNGCIFIAREQGKRPAGEEGV